MIGGTYVNTRSSRRSSRRTDDLQDVFRRCSTHNAIVANVISITCNTILAEWWSFRPHVKLQSQACTFLDPSIAPQAFNPIGIHTERPIDFQWETHNCWFEFSHLTFEGTATVSSKRTHKILTMPTRGNNIKASPSFNYCVHLGFFLNFSMNRPSPVCFFVGAFFFFFFSSLGCHSLFLGWWEQKCSKDWTSPSLNAWFGGIYRYIVSTVIAEVGQGGTLLSAT